MLTYITRQMLIMLNLIMDLTGAKEEKPVREKYTLSF